MPVQVDQHANQRAGFEGAAWLKLVRGSAFPGRPLVCVAAGNSGSINRALPEFGDWSCHA
jgi:hypothetical protein